VSSASIPAAHVKERTMGTTEESRRNIASSYELRTRISIGSRAVKRLYLWAQNILWNFRPEGWTQITKALTSLAAGVSYCVLAKG
jgi:hypothetical protein